MASASGSKTLMLLVGAIGFGIAAAILSVVYLKSREAAIIKSLKGDEQQMVAVVVANQDLPKGQEVGPGFLRSGIFPAPMSTQTQYLLTRLKVITAGFWLKT